MVNNILPYQRFPFHINQLDKTVRTIAKEYLILANWNGIWKFHNLYRSAIVILDN